MEVDSSSMETPIDMKYRDWEIPFLDILIKRDNVGTWLEFHHKLIDTQRYHHSKHSAWNGK